MVDELYQRPVATAGSLAQRLSISQSTSDRLIALLMKHGILHELTGQHRNRVFYFRDYYSLFAR